MRCINCGIYPRNGCLCWECVRVAIVSALITTLVGEVVRWLLP